MTSDLFWGDEESLTDGVRSLVKKMSRERTEVTRSNRRRSDLLSTSIVSN